MNKQLNNLLSKGQNNTIELSNRSSFSFKGNWIGVYPSTIMDKWHVGDFLIWDNRGILHQANDDYDWRNEQRELYRIMVKGERPF